MRILRAVAMFALVAAGGLCAVAVEKKASPPPAAAQNREVLFYSDLGPDSVDVASYPEQQRKNYSVYALACSRCHSLARSINAPYTTRGWWDFYMEGMRLRAKISDRPFAPEETRAILDFLDYDSRARKVDNAAAFAKSTEELKKRFDVVIERRMKELQNDKQPRILY